MADELIHYAKRTGAVRYEGQADFIIALHEPSEPGALMSHLARLVATATTLLVGNWAPPSEGKRAGHWAAWDAIEAAVAELPSAAASIAALRELFGRSGQQNPLFLTHAILLAYHHLTEPLIAVAAQSGVPKVRFSPQTLALTPEDREGPPLMDYVLDYHTRWGRLLGRRDGFWFSQAAVITKEAKELDPVWEQDRHSALDRAIAAESAEYGTELKVPREYQVEMIKSIAHIAKRKGKAYLEMCCGSGKTLTLYWIAHRLKCKFIFVLAPGLLLVKNIFDGWRRQWQAENSGGKKEGVAAKVVVLLLGSFELPPLWADRMAVYQTCRDDDVQRVYRLGLETIASGGQFWVFSTQHSSHLVSEEETKPEILIIDESHLCKEKKLDDSQYAYRPAAKYTVFASGTFEQRVKKAAVKGRQLAEYSLERAVADGVVAEYQLIRQSDEFIKSMLERCRAEAAMDPQERLVARRARRLEALTAHITHLKTLGSWKIIVFCETIEGAKEATELIAETKLVSFVAELTCKVNLKDRRKAMKAFEECRGVACLVSSRMLTTGVNLECCDGAIINRRITDTSCRQIIGRCIRRFQGKTRANVLVCGEDAIAIARSIGKVEITDRLIEVWCRGVVKELEAATEIPTAVITNIIAQYL
jgi:superfamily II DNA or RNA helicase